MTRAPEASMNAKTQPPAHPRRRRRRASAYLLVLGAAMMIAVVGLAAITSQRIELRSTKDNASSTVARYYARSAIELALLEMRDNYYWRYTYSSGPWVTDVPIGDGIYSIIGVDPIDGDLANGQLDRLVLTGIGASGGARHLAQVSLTAETQPMNTLECALYSAGMLLIVNTDVEGNDLIGSATQVNAAGSYVEVDVESAGSITGGDFDGSTTSGAAARMIPNPYTVFDYYTSNGVLINYAELLDPRENLLSNSGMERGTDSWIRTADYASLASSSSPVKSGAASLLCYDRTTESAGPSQSVSAKPQKNRSYIFRAWIYPQTPPETQTFKLSFSLKSDIDTALVSTPETSVGPGWNLIQYTLNVDWNGTLSRSLYYIETVGSNEDFWTDDAGMYDATHTRGIFSSLLSPAANPYGTQQLNTNGIYVIDCGGNAVTVDSCRIVGTLVFINASAGVTVTNLVNWEPAVTAWPSLMVDGPLAIALDDQDLDERAAGANFNPPGTPYSGSEDGDLGDDYPCVLKGLIYASGNIVIEEKTYIDGVVIGGGTVTIAKDKLNINHAGEYTGAMPPGFEGPPAMHLVKDSWQQIVD